MARLNPSGIYLSGIRAMLIGFLLITQAWSAIEVKSTREILSTSTSPIGFNTETTGFDPLRGDPIVNLWSNFPRFEIPQMRLRARVAKIEDNKLILSSDNEHGGRELQQLGDGAWAGGEIVYYAETGNAWVERGTGTIRQSTAASAGRPASLTVNQVPPGCEIGTWVFLTQRAARHESLLPPAKGPTPFRGVSFNPKDDPPAYALDSTQFAPEGGSGASLRLEIERTPTRLRLDWMHRSRDPDKSMVGKSFFAVIWVRAETPATVALGIEGIGSTQATIGPDWTPVVHRFVYPEESPDRVGVYLAFRSKGRFWVDQPAVFASGADPLAVLPEHLARWKDLPPGTPWRMWPLQKNTGAWLPLEALLRPPAALPERAGRRFWESPANATLPQLLQIAKERQLEPWIVTSLLFTGEEQRQLMEYLAGPEGTPMGDLRATHGQREPWTSVFPRLTIDMGNEAWNGMFTPSAFPRSPESYGQYAQMAFAAMASAPGFKREQFRFCLNGFVKTTGPGGYADRAVRHAPSADLVSLATYLGGWEMGGQPAGPEEALFFYERMFDKEFSSAHEMIAAHQKEGRNLGMAIYEMGPGYSLPSWDRPYDPAEENLARSLGLGLTFARLLLEARRQAWDPQAFFRYSNGHNWASHAPGTSRPEAPWLVLNLLNNAITGDQLMVELQGIPTIDLPALIAERKAHNGENRLLEVDARSGVPLLTIAVFRKPETLQLVVLSRETAKALKLNWHFPQAISGSIEIRRLTAPSLAAHNSESLNVRIESATGTGFRSGQSLPVPPRSLQVITLPLAATE